MAVTIFSTPWRALRSLRHLFIYGSVASDLGSFGALLRCHLLDLLRRTTPPNIVIRTRQLGGAPVILRTSGTDMSVHTSTFHSKFHTVDTERVPKDAKLILDLGANIGTTAAHFACLYPQARVVAVEMDAENAALARRNTERWRDRCTVVQAAIWHTDGTVEYELDPEHADSFSAGETQHRANGSGRRTVPAISGNTLLTINCPKGFVDYAKIDVEGAEREIFKNNTEWLRRVRCLQVELHGGYTKEQCAADLSALGFTITAGSGHWACVLAVNKMKP